MTQRHHFHSIRVERPRRENDLTEPTAMLIVNRQLKSGKLDALALNEDELVAILAEAGSALATLRGVRTIF